MIYLTTGGNGAGKTLFTLFDVRAQQLAENRPVYYHGFEALQPIKDFGWLPFDPLKWQDLPDGSICVFDECQNEFPAKIQGAVPDYINAVAQFRRKRGFDFWMITPHPSLIHVNIRRLIETPSWHRHLKRPAAGSLVSQITFATANVACEKPSSGSAGQVKMRGYPKEVYDWYKSATLHTAKRQIPKQVYLLAALAIIIPILFWFAYATISSKASSLPAAEKASPGATSSGPIDTGGPVPDPAPDYLASYVPRIPGLPHTAPRFDDVTKPVEAPYPAACVSMGAKCKCYTQQGTTLPTEADICKQIVANGFFMEWGTGAPSGRDRAPIQGSPGISPAVSVPTVTPIASDDRSKYTAEVFASMKPSPKPSAN